MADADFIMTVRSDGDVVKAITNTDAYLGYVSSLNIERKAYFLDYPFTEPNSTFEDHLAAAKRLKPKIAVAPDIEKGLSLEESIDQADALAEHADTVVMVPKSVHPSAVPDRFRTGLTLANYGSDAPWMVWDYQSCSSIHLLGGPPHRQLEVMNYGLKVDSLDGFSLGVYAMWGIWDGKKQQPPEEWDYLKRLEVCIDNYCRILKSL